MQKGLNVRDQPSQSPPRNVYCDSVMSTPKFLSFLKSSKCHDNFPIARVNIARPLLAMLSKLTSFWQSLRHIIANLQYAINHTF